MSKDKMSFRYIYYLPANDRYRAVYKYKGKLYNVGVFDSVIEAMRGRIEFKEQLEKKQRKTKSNCNTTLWIFYLYC